MSRVLDFTVPTLHIPAIMSYIAVGALLLTGALSRVFNATAARLYGVLAICLAAGIPFSVWPGGSVDALLKWSKLMLIWMCVVGLTTSYAECRMLIRTCGMAAAAGAALTLLVGAESVEGRLALASGRGGNPNYLAITLLVGLVCLGHDYYSGPSRNVLRKLPICAIFAITSVAFVKTGSRAGGYALIAAILLILSHLSIMKKAQAILFLAIVFGVLTAALPTHLRERYWTISTINADAVQSEIDARALGGAVGSTESRLLLLQESLEVTLGHPLFGVGLKNFPVYIASRNQELQRPKEPWYGTHNTYTQLSSEAGIPAALLFIAGLISCWRGLRRVQRLALRSGKEAMELWRAAVALQIALGAVALFLCFSHMGYDLMPYLVTAVCATLIRAADTELAGITGRAQSRYPDHAR